jgi:chromosomal replication initiator protein
LPQKIKEALPEVAERYNLLNSQELIRIVLGMIATGQIELTLVQDDSSDDNNDSSSTAINDIIIKVVSQYFGLNSEDIKGMKRTQKFSVPRQIAIYLLREETKASYPEIGEYLGKRNHTTIIYGYNKIVDLIEENNNICRDIANIREVLHQNIAP